MDEVKDNIRTRLGRETAQQQADKAVLSEVERVFDYLKKARQRADYEWFVNDQFYNNNQTLKYNTAQRRVQVVNTKADKLVVNKTAQIVRGIVSYLNKEHPTVAVLPGVSEDSAYDTAKKMKHLVDQWYDSLQLNRKNKQVTLDAAKYKIGFWKVIWDQEAIAPTTPYEVKKGQKKYHTYGDLCVERVDPFDLYWDPLGKEKTEWRYMDHVTPRTVGYMKSRSDIYQNTENLAPDQKLSSSYLKEAQIRLQTSGANVSAGTGSDTDNILVHETYLREYDAEAKRWQIRVVTWTTGRVHRNIITKLDEFPFEYYMTDVAGSPLDGMGVIRNIRDINRALNQIVSQIHENARIMGKLNWRIPRGSNINVITDETGQYIEHDATPGGAPEHIQPAAIPNYILEHAANLERYMDDIAGAHNAFYGKSPGSRASGELVNKLQEGDSNNLAMMRDNLDDGLVRLFKLMFKVYKLNASYTRRVRSTVPNEMGEYTWHEIKPEDIRLDNDIQVRSGTNMPYSLGEKQDLFLNLWKEKLITDPQVVMKLMELPDVENIVSNEQPDIERQLEEIRTIVKGEAVSDPVIAENHAVHIRVLDNYIRSPLFKEQKDTTQEALLDHRGKHVQFSIQLQMIAASMNLEPIKRNESVMIRQDVEKFTPIERTQALAKIGIQSDAADIMKRGGLIVQNPEAAEQQAQAEDLDLMDGKPVMISLGDHHLVHIETHGQVMESAEFQALPPTTQKVFKDHVTQHEQALKALTLTPGLVPSPGYDAPPQPTLVKKTAPAEAAMADQVQPPKKKLSPKTKPVYNKQ